MLLSVSELQKNYGTKQLLSGVSLYLDAGQKIGVIGVNGTGKSTLLRVLSGQEEADTGTVRFDPGVKCSYLPQDPPYDPEETVLSYVLSVFPSEEREGRAYEARTMLNRLDAGFFDRPMGLLSGGQRKRAALARVLLNPADVLLLDEPSNHLDMEMIRYLEEWLKKFRGGLIMVTHDRYFLQNVCNRIMELSLGSAYFYEANWEKYLELKAERLEAQQTAERRRITMLRDEKAWMMRGARARSTKAKAHIARFEALNNASAPELEETQKAITAGASRLGRKTVELLNVSKSFEDVPVIRGFSYTILRDDRIGVIGKNGSGKSTLLNLISGVLKPDAGSVDFGATVKIGYFRQENAVLDPAERAIDYIRGIAPALETPEGRQSAVMMMEQFLFGSDLQYAEIGKLSGGEKRRLYLLGILMAAPNILLLDEPTNDLDVETLTILENYLSTFPGAVIAVSHDRYFLDKTASVIFEVGENGAVRRFIGGYSDYEAETAEERLLKEAAKQPQKKQERPASAYPKQPKKLKFTFSEQHDYETIEERIAELEARVSEKEREMEESAQDYQKLETLNNEKTALQEELDRLTERWFYLEELKERIDRGETVE